MTSRCIEFSYDDQTGIRTATFAGILDDENLLSAYIALITAADFKPLSHDLADLRGLAEIRVTHAGLERLGKLLSGGGQMPRPAQVPGMAIVAEHPVAFGLARAYELMTEMYLPKETRVFQDIEAARAWLEQFPRMG